MWHAYGVAKPLTAAELLRAAGLLADGPVLWGQPVRSRQAGVFLIEISAAYEAAPIDITKVRAWVDRVPGLRMDGEHPTPTALAARLASFWLPDQRVVYVGRTSKSLGPRVGAAYATVLGDRRPHTGGYWLRTLHRLERLRVWWAETAAPEEYEDGLLGLFSAGVDEETRASLSDSSLILPWANLEAVTGERRKTGITGAFLAEGESPEAGAASEAPTDSGTMTAGITKPRPTTIGGLPATGYRSSSAVTARALSGRLPQPRRKSALSATSSKPLPSPTHVTADGLASLRAELQELVTLQRPQVIARVKHARELGDLRENADYEAARNEQSFVEGRIRSLEEMIKNAAVISGDHTGEVMLGSIVIIDIGGEEMTYHIVGSTEADPPAGRISNVSPIGKALVGHRAGDEVTAQLPGREITYRILDVR